MFKNLHELLLSMPTEKACRDYLIAQRWDGCPVCPYCGFDGKTYVIEGGKRFKCGASQDVCGKKYSVTVGTIFESSRIPLTKWLNAVYVVTAHKKGISSHQLGRDLGVTQRTAWFMIHRIREMMKELAPAKMDGIIQIDEAYLSRKYRSDFKGMSDPEIDYTLANPHFNKGMVIGLYDKKTKQVRPFAIGSHLNGQDMTKIIADNVKERSTIHTDESRLYTDAERNGYFRESVHHGKHEWVKPSISAGKVHTNNVENFWGVMKRAIHGTWHQISFKHLQAYSNECAYRYNTREWKDYERFIITLDNMERRLTWDRLTKKH